MKKNFSFLLLAVSFCFLLSCEKDRKASYNVMTFNIRLDFAADSLNNWKYRKSDVAEMITFYSPDLLGMQEVLHNQLNDLCESLPQYTALGVGRTDGKVVGEFNSVFYKTERFDLMDSGTYSLSETPDVIGVKGWDADCERIVTWAILKDKLTGKQLAYFNTHFDHIGEVARRESALILTKRLPELAGKLPVIITGDFNTTPDSEPIALMKQDNNLFDSREVAAIVYGPVWTFHNFGKTPIEKRPLIDYIFVSPGIEVNKYHSIKDTPDTGYLSDHNPVMVTIGVE